MSWARELRRPISDLLGPRNNVVFGGRKMS